MKYLNDKIIKSIKLESCPFCGSEAEITERYHSNEGYSISMYSIESNPMKYHGCLCPKCFQNNKLVTLYLRGTSEGIRVFKTEHTMNGEGEDRK